MTTTDFEEEYSEQSFSTIIVDLSAITRKITDKHLLKLAKKNPHLKFETQGLQKLVISMPTKSETSNQNGKLFGKMYVWNESNKQGELYDSSGGFRMPLTQSVLSPDVTFIKNELLNAVDKDNEGFYIVAPTFVLELMSKTDRLKDAKAKMEEYMKNGVELAWLLYPKKRKTFIYKQNQEVQEQSFDIPLIDNDILPNFILDLTEIFGKSKPKGE